MTTYDIIISSGMEIGEYGHVAVYVARTETDADGRAEHDTVWVGEQRSVPVEEADPLPLETPPDGDLGGWRVLTGRSAA